MKSIHKNNFSISICKGRVKTNHGSADVEFYYTPAIVGSFDEEPGDEDIEIINAFDSETGDLIDDEDTLCELLHAIKLRKITL